MSSPNELGILLKAFELVAFPAGFGFDAFTHEDIATYYDSPDQLELCLKKKRGHHLLYAPIHCELRRRFFNDLPLSTRIHLFTQKCQAQGLSVEALFGHVSEVDDIGMGHSVFKVVGTDKTVVFKRETNSMQPFYTVCLQALGWPSYCCVSYQQVGQSWELSDYLGHVSLIQALQDPSSNIDNLLTQLARHAVLGDFLGRGDRHFDNYVVKDARLYPIDISYLFCDDHDQWTQAYLAGGLYEMGLVTFLQGPYQDRLALFLDAYRKGAEELVRQYSLLHTFIQTYGDQNKAVIQKRLDFLAHQVTQFSTCFEQHLSRLKTGFSNMLHRQTYKLKLANLVHQSPEILKKEPLLKMYYLADTYRPSSFFLVEHHPTVFPILDQWEATHVI